MCTLYLCHIKNIPLDEDYEFGTKQIEELEKVNSVFDYSYREAAEVVAQMLPQHPGIKYKIK